MDAALGSPNSEDRRDAYANANDWLNAMARKKVAAAQRSGEPMSPEVAWVAKTGHQIYQNRFKPFVIVILAGSVYGALQAPSLLALLLATVFFYLYIDFYSGVLHVVLDNPDFVHLPIIGVPCVEFQWHHIFAYDISTRRLLDVWGDLNVLVVIKLLFLFPIMGFTPTSMMVAAVGFFWGYVNQWSHRLTHCGASKRPALARWLQKSRILLKPSVHHVHHSTYDDAFPVLSGHSRGLIQWLLRLVPNQWVWLIAFCAMTAVDLIGITWLLSKLAS